MNKRIILFFFSLFTVSFLMAQHQLNTAKISQSLQEAIQANPTAYQTIYLQLADKIDVRAMDQTFYRDNVSLQDRTRILVHALKQKATTTQQPILDLLQQQTNILPNSIKPYWAVNAIFLEAKTDVIAALSQRDDVEWININAAIQLEEHTDHQSFMPPAPNAIEPGLAAINAPNMWEIGYTGYGRKALIIDTGVDPTHPALSNNYWGNTVGDLEAWYNHTGTTPTPFDCGDHGTHVTGTILGLDRNTSDTIGVAFGANWMGSPGICGAAIGNTVASFQWAIDPDGDSTTTTDQPDVINNSWYAPSQAGTECTGIYTSLLASVEAAGIAVVFSAGNAGPGPTSITPPKNINWDLVNVFAVGALNGNSPNFPIANFSSRGPSVCGDTASLLIKPEVSAPGQNVRSCEPGNTYGSKSGTSMAAPHVSGAILLLKQAFPYLTGTEIKLALYFSAIDLGIPGEDNTYGMGIIDVFGAYNYLINQGNAPVSPTTANDVVLGGLSNINEINCNKDVTPLVQLINGGSDTLTSATIVYTYSNGLIDSILWTGNLPSFQSTLIALPTVNLGTGEYTISIQAKLPNGVVDNRDLDNSVYDIFYIADDELVQTMTDTVCLGNEALLTASYNDSDATIQWFNHLGATTPINSGTTFITPPLTANTTYYTGYTNQKFGSKTDSTGNGGIHNGTDRHLVFDAHRPFILKSVKVYADDLGGRLIELRNEQGNNIAIKPVIMQAGEQRITLNLNVPRGKNLQLGVGNRSDMYRNQGNLSFPYQIKDVVSITGTNANNPTDNYYYFYDWEIEYTDVCGRTATAVEVLDNLHTTTFGSSVDTININLTSGTVFFQDSTINAVSWFWDFGDGNTSTAQNPSNIYTTPGTYQVILQTESSIGCSDLSTKTIVVEGVVSTQPIDYSSAVKVFPNPSNGQFNVQFSFNSNKKVNMTLVDVLGRKIKNYGLQNIGQQTISLDLNTLENGIYYLQMEVDGTILTKKLIKL